MGKGLKFVFSGTGVKCVFLGEGVNSGVCSNSQMERSTEESRGHRHRDIVMTAVAVRAQRTRTQYENHCWKDHRFLNCGVPPPPLLTHFPPNSFSVFIMRVYCLLYIGLEQKELVRHVQHKLPAALLYVNKMFATQWNPLGEEFLSPLSPAGSGGCPAPGQRWIPPSPGAPLNQDLR